MKKCAYQIHVVDYKTENSEPDEWDFHYQNAIDAVKAWHKFQDNNGQFKRVCTFLGAAGDMDVKIFNA